MATGIGYLGYAGMVKQSDLWTVGTVDNKIPFTSEGITKEYARIESEWLGGTSGRRGDEQGPLSVVGAIDAVMVHDELDSGEFIGVGLPLSVAMGTVTYDAGSGANQITLADAPATAVTTAVEKTVGIHEIIGTMFKGFTITGEPTSSVKCTFDTVSYDYLTTGQTNASSDLNTLPTVKAEELIWGDMYFRMATDFSNILAAADNIGISAFTVTYDAAMSDPAFATPLNTASAPYGTSGSKTLQPERNDFRMVTLDITVPRYDADTWFTAYAADNPIQAEFKWAASATRNLWIYFPYLKIINITGNIAGPDFIPIEVTLQAFRGTDYNAGAGNTVQLMSDSSTVIVEEFAIETDNDRVAAIFS